MDMLEKKQCFKYNKDVTGREESDRTNACHILFAERLWVPLKTDTITKDYVKNASIFADIFNYYIYGGQQVILPEHLAERDPSEIALPYGADGAAVPVQKFRDVQKLYAAMTDGKIEYVLYGIENQAEIHYAGPVKNRMFGMVP